MAKKKIIKTLLAGLVAALMIGSVSPAFAADPPEKSDLYIHKYSLSDISQSGQPGTGEVSGVPSTAEPVNGVVFTIYKVDTTLGTPAAGKIYSYASGNLVVYDNDVTTVLGTYPIVSEYSVTTSGAGVALKAEMPQGVYLIIETDNSGAKDVNGRPVEINLKCKPFIVSLPMTNAAGDGYLTEIHIYPKNEALFIDKEVNVNDGDAIVVGDVISYTITASIPDGITESKKYDIVDALDGSLDLVVPAGGLNAAVTISTQPTNDAGLIAGDDYVVRYESDHKLVVSFTENGRAKLDGYTWVKISFSTSVNASILSKVDLTVPNEAKLQFRNDQDTDFEANTGGGGPRVHTAGIEVIKTDQAGNSLNGAEFKVATSEAKAKAGRFLHIDPATSKIYDVEDPEYGSFGDYVISPSNKSISANPAVASFLGLRDKVGGAYQTYWVVETLAPTGYNLVSAPKTVAFDGSEINYLSSLEVTNNKGFVLPETGGLGTILFAIGGVVLLGLAVLILIVPRRKRRDINS